MSTRYELAARFLAAKAVTFNSLKILDKARGAHTPGKHRRGAREQQTLPPIEKALCVLFAGAIDRLLCAAPLPPIAVGS